MTERKHGIRPGGRDGTMPGAEEIVALGRIKLAE